MRCISGPSGIISSKLSLLIHSKVTRSPCFTFCTSLFFNLSPLDGASA